MDPFSITAGVVGTAGVALHSARRVKDFVGGIQGAPRAISALSKDLTALADVLETLNTLVNHVHLSGGAAHTDFIPLLKPPLENCTTALDSIFLTIKPYTKPSGQPKKSKWRGFVWTFRETEVLTLQKTLMDYKMSLDIALAVANLYVEYWLGNAPNTPPHADSVTGPRPPMDSATSENRFVECVDALTRIVSHLQIQALWDRVLLEATMDTR